MPTIRTDPRITKLLRKLTPVEESLLSASIKLGGVTDPIVIFLPDGEKEHVLLDGHNRMRLATKHGRKFDWTLPAAPDGSGILSKWDDAIAWVKERQGGRRNMTPEELSKMRGEAYAKARRPRGAHRTLASDDGAALAKELGVSERTLRRDAEKLEGRAVPKPKQRTSASAAVRQLVKLADVVEGHSPLEAELAEQARVAWERIGAALEAVREAE